MVEIANATQEHRLWVYSHSTDYIETCTESGIDIVFCPKDDAHLEELLSI